MLNNKLTNAVRLAIAFGATSTAAFSGAVYAAEEGAEAVERIEVTGSRIKRTDMEGALPVSSFSLQDIQASGAPTLEQFVQQLPVISGGSFGSNVNNGGTGSVTMNIRGLGASRTLVLLNGRRFSGDISIIPMSAIQRVDILRDGASTIYGSDAIAGVVNFITSKDYTGAQLDVRYQQTSENDGETSNISFVTGVESDKGNVVFSAGWEHREAIYGSQRDFSSCPRLETDSNDDGINDEIFCGGSSHAYPARFRKPGDRTNYVKGADGKERVFNDGDRYNYASTSILYQPLEKYNMFTAGQYELIDGGFTSLEFFGEAYFTHRQSKTQMAPVATFWGVKVPEAHPANTFGTDVTAFRRLAETGGRIWERDVFEYAVTSGFRGELSNGWFWDTSYTYNNRRSNRITGGRVHQERANTLVDPVKCEADSSCPGLWDPFVKGSLTEEMQDWIIVPLTDLSKSKDTQLMFNLTGDTGGFELPAGAISWAVGYEHLTTAFTSVPDGAAGLGQIYSTTSSSTDGRYTTGAVYGEVSIPVLSDVAFAESLDVTFAARRTKVNLIDDAEVTKKLAVEWRPSSELLIRGNYSEGFRTPSISTLFSPQSRSANTYSDPCVNWGKSDNANLKANCAADGLPADWSQTNRQSGSWVGGDPNIGPEKSESMTFGFAWSPAAIENFSMTLDYYDISISDVIGSLGIGTIARECYSSTNFSSPMCAQIKGPVAYGTVGGARRDSTDSLSGVVLSTQNLGFFDSRGIDFEFDYTLDAFGGQIDFDFKGTYLLEHNHLEAEGLEVSELVGKYGNDVANGGRGAFNDLRASLRTSYSSGDWGISHSAQYQSSVDDFAPRDSFLSTSVGSVIYHDLSGFYHVSENFKLSGGVNNAADKEPPYVSQGDNGMLIRVHRLTGREYYLRATFKF